MPGNKNKLVRSDSALSTDSGFDEEYLEKDIIINDSTSIEYNVMNLVLSEGIFEELDKKMKTLTDENDELKSNLKKVSEEKEQLEEHNKGLSSVIKKSVESANEYDNEFNKLSVENGDLKNTW